MSVCASFIAVNVFSRMRKKQKDYAENEDFFYYPFHRNAVPSLENVDVYFFFFFFFGPHDFTHRSWTTGTCRQVNNKKALEIDR